MLETYFLLNSRLHTRPVPHGSAVLGGVVEQQRLDLVHVRVPAQVAQESKHPGHTQLVVVAPASQLCTEDSHVLDRSPVFVVADAPEPQHATRDASDSFLDLWVAKQLCDRLVREHFVNGVWLAFGYFFQRKHPLDVTMVAFQLLVSGFVNEVKNAHWVDYREAQTTVELDVTGHLGW